MILLRLLSLPYVRKHRLRTALTALGIALGVGLFLGLAIAERTVFSAFSSTIDRIAGRAQLQVTAGDIGFDEGVLEDVQADPSVEAAVPIIEAVVDSPTAGQGSLYLLGVDMTGDRSVRDYDLQDGDADVVADPLVFLAQPDSIIVADGFAARNHLAVGSAVTLRTSAGDRRFTVRGIMRPAGMATAFGGNVAVVDIYAAQKVLDRGRRFDRVDVVVKPGISIARCRDELRARLGAGFQVEEPASRGQALESMRLSYSAMSDVASAFAVAVAMFIIYNAFAIAVTERRAEIGVVRALGATRRQIQALFLGESVVLGLIGSAAGVLAGLIAARDMAAWLGGFVQKMHGATAPLNGISPSPMLVAGAGILGVLTSAAAAFLPARAAAREDPVHALQRSHGLTVAERQSRIRITAAAVCAGVAAACLPSGRATPIYYTGLALLILGAVLVNPLLCVWLSRAIRPLLGWWRPVEGSLAVDSMIQAPKRTAASVAPLMLAIALVVILAGAARASFATMGDWINTSLNADLFVTSSPSITDRRFLFPASMASELAAVPGVDVVQPVRLSHARMGDRAIAVGAIDMANVARTVRPKVIVGDEARMFRLAAEGRGLIVSANFAQLQHVSLGDRLEIPAPAGTIRLPVVGVVLDFSEQRGVVFMDRKLFFRYWHDGGTSFFRVYLVPGADRAEVTRQILARYAGQRQIFVLTNRDIRDYTNRLNNDWFALSWIQIAIAMIVATLGVVNSLTVSVTDRRRELGVLRAVGALRGQVRRAIVIEGLSMAAVGMMLGLALGAIGLNFVLGLARSEIVGVHLEYLYPFSTAAVMAAVILAAVSVAALAPAAAAARAEVADVLAYE